MLKKYAVWIVLAVVIIGYLVWNGTIALPSSSSSGPLTAGSND